jgi:phosphohistidine swiveling domain-containing protein
MIETTDTTAGELRFDPPGPGPWLLDACHVPRPWTRFQQEIHPPSLGAGFRAMSRRYGLLVDGLNWQFVNGFAYYFPSPPPEHEIPERFAAAERAFAERIWREDRERWDRSIKPAAVAAHRRLQAVDPSGLDTAGLLAQLDRCREHQRRMIEQHHEMNGAAFVPVGDFLAQACEWTGLPGASVLELTRGSSPESTGSCPELERVLAAARRDAGAYSVLEADVPAGEALARLCAWPGEVGAAAREYLETVGHRLLDSLDVGDPTLLEVPEVVVRGLREGLAGDAGHARALADEHVARVRDQVPAASRPTFDALLEETRLTYGVRDERGLFSEVWAGGITRRVVLAAGARLAAEGRIAEPVHLIEAGYAEMRDLIAGVGGPSADDLAARALYRAGHSAAEAPPTLGPPPGPPPPLDGLPPAAARGMRAISTAIEALFGHSDAVSEATVVRGTGASAGRYTGTARLVSGPAELGRLRAGEVLVTPTTTEAFNVVLPLLGAIVTDAGGLLSHPAIVSREYGIPGIVGTMDATTLIPDGALVEVDGAAGEVRVVR